MKSGRKADVTVPPLDLRRLPRHRGARACRFIEGYIKLPRGVGAKRYVKLRHWQRSLIYGALRPGVRQALWSMGRGNAKTTAAAMLGLYGLYADGVEGAQVPIVASDERQAGIAFGIARRMVQLNPKLDCRCQIFKDKLYLPQTDSTLMPLPAEPDALQGWDPSLCIADELHVVTEKVYESMALASGKRDHSLLLCISTVADNKDSVMWRLTEHGRRGDDPSFFYAEFSAPDGCDIDDEAAWRAANPALGDFLNIDALRSTMRTTREESFRQFRLNQWTGRVGSWLPWGMWDGYATSRLVNPGEEVVLFFDGSASGDSTALIGCTLDGFIFVVDIWENDGDPRWRVPRADVAHAIEDAHERYSVLELAADPWGWRSELESWSQRFNVVEWPCYSIPRMAPATDKFYAALADGRITHDGDPRLSRHVANCVAKRTKYGDVVVKDSRESPRKIDAAVGAIGAYDRATYYASKPRKRRRVVAW